MTDERTRPWAENRRVITSRTIRGARDAPRQARVCFDEFRTDQPWRLLTKADGSPFANFVDFIETPEPYGWGCKWTDLRPVLKAEAEQRGEDGEKSVQLDFEATQGDGRSTNAAGQSRDERGRVLSNASDLGHDVLDRTNADKRQANRLRATARAPEPARELYRQGLLGVNEAAALGPLDRDTNPEKAALTTEAALAAVEAIKDEPEPKTATDKRRLQRKANEAVRTVMNRQAPDREALLVKQLVALDDERFEIVIINARLARKEARAAEGKTGSKTGSKKK